MYMCVYIYNYVYICVVCLCVYVCIYYVFLWLSGRALLSSAKGRGFDSQETHVLTKKMYCLKCKSPSLLNA